MPTKTIPGSVQYISQTFNDAADQQAMRKLSIRLIHADSIIFPHSYFRIWDAVVSYIGTDWSWLLCERFNIYLIHNCKLSSATLLVTKCGHIFLAECRPCKVCAQALCEVHDRQGQRVRWWQQTRTTRQGLRADLTRSKCKDATKTLVRSAHRPCKVTYAHPAKSFWSDLCADNCKIIIS